MSTLPITVTATYFTPAGPGAAPRYAQEILYTPRAALVRWPLGYGFTNIELEKRALYEGTYHVKVIGTSLRGGGAILNPPPPPPPRR